VRSNAEASGTRACLECTIDRWGCRCQPLSRWGNFAFIQAWAAFLWPLLVANQRDLFNIDQGVNAFQFRYGVDYGPLMAGSVLSVLPM
jgi:multiple sugar transport system permease protein